MYQPYCRGGLDESVLQLVVSLCWEFQLSRKSGFHVVQTQRIDMEMTALQAMRQTTVAGLVALALAVVFILVGVALILEDSAVFVVVDVVEAL